MPAGRVAVLIERTLASQRDWSQWCRESKKRLWREILGWAMLMLGIVSAVLQAAGVPFPTERAFYVFWLPVALAGLVLLYSTRPDRRLLLGVLLIVVFVLIGYEEEVAITSGSPLRGMWLPIASIVSALLALLTAHVLAARMQSTVRGLEDSTARLRSELGELERDLEPVVGMPGYIECAARLYEQARRYTVTVLRSWHWDARLRNALSSPPGARVHYFVGPMNWDQYFGGLVCRFALGQDLEARQDEHRKRFVFYHAGKPPARFVATDQEVVTTGSGAGSETVRGFVTSTQPELREFYGSFHKVILSQPQAFEVRSFLERITELVGKIWDEVAGATGGPRDQAALGYFTGYAWKRYHEKCEAAAAGPVDRREFERAMVTLLNYLIGRGKIDGPPIQLPPSEGRVIKRRF